MSQIDPKRKFTALDASVQQRTSAFSFGLSFAGLPPFGVDGHEQHILEEGAERLSCMPHKIDMEA